MCAFRALCCANRLDFGAKDPPCGSGSVQNSRQRIGFWGTCRVANIIAPRVPALFMRSPWGISGPLVKIRSFGESFVVGSALTSPGGAGAGSSGARASQMCAAFLLAPSNTAIIDAPGCFEWVLNTERILNVIFAQSVHKTTNNMYQTEEIWCFLCAFVCQARQEVLGCLPPQ